MQKNMNMEERFEVMEADALMEVQGGTNDKGNAFVSVIRNTILELFGLSQQNN